MSAKRSDVIGQVCLLNMKNRARSKKLKCLKFVLLNYAVGDALRAGKYL